MIAYLNLSSVINEVFFLDMKYLRWNVEEGGSTSYFFNMHAS